jgi:hypothetical protein
LTWKMCFRNSPDPSAVVLAKELSHVMVRYSKADKSGICDRALLQVDDLRQVMEGLMAWVIQHSTYKKNSAHFLQIRVFHTTNRDRWRGSLSCAKKAVIRRQYQETKFGKYVISIRRGGSFDDSRFKNE